MRWQGRRLRSRSTRCGSGPGGVTQAGGWSARHSTTGSASTMGDAHASLVTRRRRGARSHRLGSTRSRSARSSASSGCRPTSRASTRQRHRVPCGRNIDCKELVAGTTLYLPIAGRRRAALGWRRSCGAGRRRGLAARDRGACRAGAAHAVRSRRPPARDADRVDAGGVAHVRIRRGPRRGSGARDRRDARAHGSRARSRATRSARARERRRRPARHAARERSTRESTPARARRRSLDDNQTRCPRGRPGRRAIVASSR